MSFKTCAKCGEDNPVNAGICIICGSSLRDAARVTTPPPTESPTVLSLNICPGCNERVPNHIRYCPNCATLIAKTSMDLVANQGRNGYQTGSGPGGCVTVLLFFISFFFPLVGLIVGGIGWFSAREEMQSFGKALFIFSLVIAAIEISLGILAVALR